MHDAKDPPSSEPNALSHDQISTGVDGLDALLRGGLPATFTYLIQGETGTGKTTLGLQFARAGVQAGDSVLYLALSERKKGLEYTAHSHGWSLEGIHVHELSAAREDDSGKQTLFHTAEIELEEVIEGISDAIEQVQPDRVVFDSISEIRLLSQSAYRYRRQLLILEEQLVDLNCTTLLLKQTTREGEKALQSLIHGVIQLKMASPDYGKTRRQLQVCKLRGLDHRTGYHDFEIGTGGLEVYPRIQLDHKEPPEQRELVQSGVEALDALLYGGLEEGSSTILIGPTGTGKSTLATLYARHEALRGRSSAIFLFDEEETTFYQRMRSLGLSDTLDVDPSLFHVEHVKAEETSIGAFAHRVRTVVEEQNARVVIIDGLRGYMQTLPQERVLLTHLHDLLAYLTQEGALSFLTATQYGFADSRKEDTVKLSYLADTALMLRYFEGGGFLRRALTVLKKRYGDHDRTIREFFFSKEGVQIGPPLISVQNIFGSIPSFEGENDILLDLGTQRDGTAP